MGERLLDAARRAAEAVEKSGADPIEALRGVEARVSRDEACRVRERLAALVEAYRPIEEGGVPSNAFLALEAASRVFERLCGGGRVDDDEVRLALAILGLLERGRVARAAALAAALSQRLRRSP